MPKAKSRNQKSGDPDSPLAAVEDAIEAIGRSYYQLIYRFS